LKVKSAFVAERSSKWVWHSPRHLMAFVLILILICLFTDWYWITTIPTQSYNYWNCTFTY